MEPEMTTQEIFTRVVTHLLRQNERSVNSAWQCAYRGQRGLKCAVGVLIKDDKYSPELEGKGVFWGSIDNAPMVVLNACGATMAQAELLGHLQYIHDCADPGDWRDKLSAAAERFGLEMPGRAIEAG